MISKPQINIVLMGHVDHGKSTLIGRLLLDTKSLSKDKISEIEKISKELRKDAELSFLTDQLKEEREQGKTIDTTQVFFRTRKRNFVLIDAPGHAELIKNTFTGASFADAAILIIDAASGIQEQTIRHAYITRLLGINNLLVVINKMDLVNYRKGEFLEIQTRLLALLDKLKIKPLRIIPVSAKYGINILRKNSKLRWYKGPTLIGALNALSPGRKGYKSPLRFSIQDVYEIGAQKIIAGKVLSGEIKQGQTVKLIPSLNYTRINSIKAFGKSKNRARAGENVGLILDRASCAVRGGIIVEKGCFLKPTDNFKAKIFWILLNPLRLNKALVFRCANQEVGCMVKKIDAVIDSSTLKMIKENPGRLNTNQAAVVTIQTERPIVIDNSFFAEDLGRFLIEQGGVPSGVGIIA